MFDNMTEIVAFVMYEDRLATAARNRQLWEAERVRPPSRGTIGAAYRATLAQGRTTLATRIAPMVGRSDTGTPAPAR